MFPWARLRSSGCGAATHTRIIRVRLACLPVDPRCRDDSPEPISRAKPNHKQLQVRRSRCADGGSTTQCMIQPLPSLLKKLCSARRPKTGLMRIPLTSLYYTPPLP